jgi:hypothetical protein
MKEEGKKDERPRLDLHLALHRVVEAAVPVDAGEEGDDVRDGRGVDPGGKLVDVVVCSPLQAVSSVSQRQQRRKRRTERPQLQQPPNNGEFARDEIGMTPNGFADRVDEVARNGRRDGEEVGAGEVGGMEFEGGAGAVFDERVWRRKGRWEKEDGRDGGKSVRLRGQYLGRMGTYAASSPSEQPQSCVKQAR